MPVIIEHNFTPPMPTRRHLLYSLFGGMAGGTIVQGAADRYAENRVEGPNASPGAQLARLAPPLLTCIASKASQVLSQHSQGVFVRRMREATPPTPFCEREPVSYEELESEMTAYSESTAQILEEVATKNAYLLRRAFWARMAAEVSQAAFIGAIGRSVIDFFTQNVERAARHRQGKGR